VNQPLQHVEPCRCRGVGEAAGCHEHGVAAAPLRFLKRACRGRQQDRHRRAVLRVARERAADRDRQPLGALELEADLGEPRLERVRGRLEDPVRPDDADEEELVRSRSADREWRADCCLEHSADRAQRCVSGGMSMVLVEQAEVVDVDKRDLEPFPRGLRGLDALGQDPDQCPVVEQARQLIASRRFDELLVASSDATAGMIGRGILGSEPNTSGVSPTGPATTSRRD
jgi:hypothetical protein